MVIFTYDKTFEGLLSVVFEAYERKLFPDSLWDKNEPLPLFYETVVMVNTDETKAGRVWKALSQKLSKTSLAFLTLSWLSELPQVDSLLFRYIRKNIDAPHSIEMNFGDPDVLEISKIGKKVSQEKHRVIQFARFQKTKDDIYFAALKPLFNVLPLTTQHFCDRFAGQRWILYDLKRGYGYYYDLKNITEIRFSEEASPGIDGHLLESQLADDEKLFQKLWQEYFKALCIRERINPKLHRQNLPARFWKYLIEKKG